MRNFRTKISRKCKKEQKCITLVNRTFIAKLCAYLVETTKLKPFLELKSKMVKNKL